MPQNDQSPASVVDLRMRASRVLSSCLLPNEGHMSQTPKAGNDDSLSSLNLVLRVACELRETVATKNDRVVLQLIQAVDSAEITTGNSHINVGASQCEKKDRRGLRYAEISFSRCKK